MPQTNTQFLFSFLSRISPQFSRDIIQDEFVEPAQMAELFQKDRTVISRHIRNVFNEGELEEQSTCAKFAHMGHDGLQQYETVMYNLDVTDLAYQHLAVGGPLGADGAYTCSAEPGEFHVWIAPNAAEGTPAKFILQD